MNNCIICGDDSGLGMVCHDCQETIKYYKKIYMVNKTLNETTELDDQMFDILYKTAGIDEIIHEDVYSFFPSTTDELLNDIKEALNECLPKDNWITQQEGRMDKFLEFIRYKIEDERRNIIP